MSVENGGIGLRLPHGDSSGGGGSGGDALPPARAPENAFFSRACDLSSCAGWLEVDAAAPLCADSRYAPLRAQGVRDVSHFEHRTRFSFSVAFCPSRDEADWLADEVGVWYSPFEQFCKAAPEVKSVESFKALFEPCVDALFSGTAPLNFRVTAYNLVYEFCTKRVFNTKLNSTQLYNFVVALADAKAGAWVWADSESAEAWERGAGAICHMFSFLDRYHIWDAGSGGNRLANLKEVLANARARYEK